MSLTKISLKNEEDEKNILNNIFKCIDERTSMMFNSGAGSGKTYSLIESLKYIINNYNEDLKNNNQKVICITYTNVATNEIKERLGNTSNILVSTIHERIWNLIKNYQKELVEIHKENIIKEIEEMDSNLNDNDVYKDLDSNQKETLHNVIEANEKLYYNSKILKASEFKKIFNDKLTEVPFIIKNVEKFKKVANTILNLKKYKICKENIDSTKYRAVEYTPLYNKDRLYKMRISHDTLLSYGFEIINKYDLLKQIIIDKYPFIFIDEYQDTDKNVIKIMGCLNKYSNEINHKFFVGYFGDHAQNIYEKGIGNKISEFHFNLKLVNKNFNRRSTMEIIDISNKIRNDQMLQQSIFEDCNGGSVKFYVGSSADIYKFIKKYSDKWKITEDNQLHCFVLTNKKLAEFGGFKNLYNALNKTSAYSGYRYNQLNTELLSNDISKLGEIPSLLYRIIKLKVDIENDNTQLKSIFDKNIYEDISIKNLKKLIMLLKQIKGDTLGEYIKSISNIYIKNDIQIIGKFRRVIDSIFDFKNISYEKFENYLMEKLYYNERDDSEKFNDILDLNIEELILWYKYILNLSQGKVVFHTCHGTKGLEFKNVIIILERSFGKNINYFENYFKNYNNEEILIEKEKNKFNSAKNLLYVSISRTIKNLRILYLDDIKDFSDKIEGIFGEIYTY